MAKPIQFLVDMLLPFFIFNRTKTIFERFFNIVEFSVDKLVADTLTRALSYALKDRPVWFRSAGIRGEWGLRWNGWELSWDDWRLW